MKSPEATKTKLVVDNGAGEDEKNVEMPAENADDGRHRRKREIGKKNTRVKLYE